MSVCSELVKASVLDQDYIWSNRRKQNRSLKTPLITWDIPILQVSINNKEYIFKDWFVVRVQQLNVKLFIFFFYWIEIVIKQLL